MKAAFYTLGCKVNQYETEYMTELLKNAGFDIVSPDEQADCYIINSCTVTATADRKTRQSVRKFKRNNPDSTVILTGCMPQAFPNSAEKLDEADIVISNKSNNDILEFINSYELENKRIVHIDKHKNNDEFAKCSIDAFNERIRAFVKIEDGCDRFCTYCIIPMSRGRVRSKEPSDLKNEITDLANNGIKEIVLVGINLSSYGTGKEYNIVDAVKICADNEKILRVRLGSLEPDHMTDEVLEGLSGIKKFCPQFHISLQSGCDRTLHNMNRHYTAEDYRKLCEKIRNTFDNPSITTDIMVGFHEESNEDFMESLSFAKEIAFDKVHVFPYSQREGTVASRRGDSIPKQIKEERAAIMIEHCEKIRHKYFNSLIGTKQEVLFESCDGCNVYRGYTENYIPVRYESKNDLVGKVLTVEIKSVDEQNDICIGG